MKKLSIVILVFLFAGIESVFAQTDANTETTTNEVKKECPWTKNADGKLICTKTGKICSEACVNKSKGKCCKGKRKGYSGCSKGKRSNYSKGMNKGFSFGKSDKKCGPDCTKPCCAKTPESDENEVEENVNENPAEDNTSDE